MLNATKKFETFLSFGRIFALQLLFKCGFLCPGIISGNVFVAKAESSMVRVVVLFAFDHLHRIGTGHGFLSWAVDWP